MGRSGVFKLPEVSAYQQRGISGQEKACYGKILLSPDRNHKEKTTVNRSLLVFAGVLACAGILPAENPMITENKQNYTAIKNNILAAAEKMPDDGYAFQATKEERTWAALMGHIADAQTGICSSATGVAKRGGAAKLTDKAALVAALKESNAVCDAAWDSTNDENAHSMVNRMNRDFTRLGLLIYNTTHDNESYGTMAVYLRLKGVVPPSSEKK
jgi:uncharacterized damage-inducible protein DinB